MKYGIGIDTGGTFTDSVLVDIETGIIKAFAKALTTHHDLKEGIENCLAALQRKVNFSREEVAFTGVSSTLATNAVVENKGGDVALFLIGLEKHMDLPVAGFKFIKGGHDIYGNEVEKFDIEAMVDSVSFFKGRVDSYAVVSSMSFVNPAHEILAGEAIKMIDGSPFYLSSEVSSAPGMEERAATTVLNSRLMPVMESFITGLKASIEKYCDIENLKIIDGQGSFMSFSDAVKKSVKTFGSGPASTAFFAIGKNPSTIVIDMGGTTTDILLIENSKPVIDDKSRIGDFETHVKSVKIKTLGLGGDSRVSMDYRKEICIGPEKVKPLCFSENIPSPAGWINFSDSYEIYFLRNKNIRDENGFIKFFDDALFLSIEDFYKKAGFGEKTREIVRNYVRKNGFGVCGFTPTDALAILGKIDAPYPGASIEAAKILGSFYDMDYINFCEKTVDEVENKIVDAVIDFFVRYSSGKGIKELFPNWRNSPYLDINFGSKIPVTGVGAASVFFLEGVCNKLDTELAIPDFYEVGNAVGAVKTVLEKYKK